MSSTAHIQSFNEQLIAEFRANGGQTTGPFANRPLLLLTTTGAKSGQPRTTPLVHTTDGDRLVVIASKGGAPSSPAWFHNLVANPVVTIELGTETFQARATVAQEPERTRLYEQQAALMPSFADYQRKTTREIPAVILARIN